MTIEELLEKVNRHKEYSIDEYADYCADIRSRIWKQSEGEQYRDFFEKKFVEEMEPLSKITKHFFDSSRDQIKVQFVEHDPPDGRIFLSENKQIIDVEFTTARDMRLERYCLEQNRLGNPTSTSGHTSADISGSKNRGYSLQGYPVEADSLEEFVEKLKNQTEVAIERKLLKSWNGQTNWLCITIPDYSVPVGSSDVEGWTLFKTQFSQALSQILVRFAEDLTSKRITMVWIVGFADWISAHPINKAKL